MDADDFQHAITEIRILMMLVMKMSTGEFNQHLAANNFDINAMQFGMVRALYHHHYTLSELSKLFMLDPSTLVPAVDALEKKGLIERGRDPNDRRRTPLHLTEEGITLFQKVSQMPEDSKLVKSFSEMGEAKTLQLLGLLRELIQTMPEADRIFCDMQDHLKFRESSKNKIPSSLV